MLKKIPEFQFEYQMGFTIEASHGEVSEFIDKRTNGLYPHLTMLLPEVFVLDYDAYAHADSLLSAPFTTIITRSEETTRITLLFFNQRPSEHTLQFVGEFIRCKFSRVVQYTYFTIVNQTMTEQQWDEEQSDWQPPLEEQLDFVYGLPSTHDRHFTEILREAWCDTNRDVAARGKKYLSGFYDSLSPNVRDSFMSEPNWECPPHTITTPASPSSF